MPMNAPPQPGRSILLLGNDSAQFGAIEHGLGDLPGLRVSTASGGLAAANGHALELSQSHDLIVFATNASDADITALSALSTGGAGDAVFVALTDDDIPLSRARRLLEAGAAEVLPRGMDANLLSMLRSEAMAPVREEPAMPDNGTVIAVAQARGGAGGTTVTVNLAVALARLGRRTARNGDPARVAILDFDIQFGSAGVFLDVEDNGALVELIAGSEAPGRRAILAAAQSSPHGVDVLCAPALLVPPNAMSRETAAAIVKAFAGAYDHVIIDLPRAAMDWIEPVIARTDRLVLVTDMSVPCLRHAKRLRDFFLEAQVALPVDLVMNREKKPLLGSDALREAEKLLGNSVAAWFPEQRAAERKAVDQGSPAAARRSPSRRLFERFAKHLIKAGKATHTSSARGLNVQ